MADPMTLRDEDVGRIGEYVKPWLRELVGEMVPSPEPVGARLLERMVRVEEELRAQRTLMDERFGFMAARFEAIDKRFDAVDKRFEDLIGQMNVRFEAVDKRFEAVDKRFEAVDKRFEDLISQMKCALRDGGPAVRRIESARRQPFQDAGLDDRFRVRHRYRVDHRVRTALLSPAQLGRRGARCNPASPRHAAPASVRVPVALLLPLPGGDWRGRAGEVGELG